jgi:hypothetical protein
MIAPCGDCNRWTPERDRGNAIRKLVVTDIFGISIPELAERSLPPASNFP